MCNWLHWGKVFWRYYYNVYSDKIVDYWSIGAIEFDREGGKKLLVNRFCGHIERAKGWKLDPALNIWVI